MSTGRILSSFVALYPIREIRDEKMALKILGVKIANELGEIAASAGLAYNLAALKALVTTGIHQTVR